MKIRKIKNKIFLRVNEAMPGKLVFFNCKSTPKFAFVNTKLAHKVKEKDPINNFKFE